MGGWGVNTEKSLCNSGLQKTLDTGTSFASSATLFDEAYGNQWLLMVTNGYWLMMRHMVTNGYLPFHYQGLFKISDSVKIRLFNMRTFLVQRSPNLCPKIYVVLYFVSTQIDRMYISEDQSSECDDNWGATVRYFNSFHQTHAHLIWAWLVILCPYLAVLLPSVLGIQAFSDKKEIVRSVLVYKTGQIPMTTVVKGSNQPPPHKCQFRR